MTHNRSTDAARDPWRASLRASRERRDSARRTRQWSFRRRSVTFCACAVMALGGGVAAAGTGGTSAGNGGSTADESTRAASSTLEPGSSGPTVKRLQRKLRVKVTGYYGPLTKRAVKRYQRRAGLKADGVAGPETLARLGIRMPPPPAQDDTGAGSDVEVPEVLQRIAECESGGNPRAVSADGRYRGKYQFDMETWQAIGGTGDPAEAPEAEQDRLAVKLYRARGTDPWPHCSQA